MAKRSQLPQSNDQAPVKVYLENTASLPYNKRRIQNLRPSIVTYTGKSGQEYRWGVGEIVEVLQEDADELLNKRLPAGCCGDAVPKTIFSEV